MIFVYLDWNVISQMKNGMHDDLYNKLMQPERFILPYSTSHIGDIFSSFSEDVNQMKNIDSDTEFLSEISRNYCLSNNGKKIDFSFFEPKELLEQRISEKDSFKDLNIDKLLGDFEGDEITGDAFRLLKTLLKNIPLDNEFKKAFENPETSKQLEMFLPGLKDNPTMEGFFETFGKLLTNLNEQDGYKDLRKLTQSGLGINRDKIFHSDSPYDIINKAYNKLNINLDDFIPEDKTSPEWFSKITNEYIRLDMHGYQEDKVNIKKGRKETFKNTTEDAFHAAFASTCDYYIINDNKSYKKTQQIFESLQLNTLVFKPQEFLDYYKNYIPERTLDYDFQLPIQYLKSEPYAEKQVDNGVLRSYYIPSFIFDFFNKMHVLSDTQGVVKMILLGQFYPTNKKITYYFEIENLSKKLYELFGNDIDNKGQITKEELDNEDWAGRKWEFEKINFSFIRVNGHYQLYYDYLDGQDDK